MEEEEKKGHGWNPSTHVETEYDVTSILKVE